MKCLNIKKYFVSFAAFLTMFLFLCPKINATTLSSSDFSPNRPNYFYRFGYCETGFAAYRPSAVVVVSQADYIARQQSGQNMDGYGINFVSDRAYGEANAYNAREIFNSKSVYDPFTKGVINYDNHGYHGSNAVLLNDNEVLPCFEYIPGQWAQVKYNGERVWLPIFANEYRNTQIIKDSDEPILSVSWTPEYNSSETQYTDTTKDFIFSFSTSDSGSGINHLEYKVIQYNKNNSSCGQYTMFGKEGPYNPDERNAWNDTVNGSINLGKQYGIFAVEITSFDGAGNTFVYTTPKFYVDRVYPNQPTYSLSSDSRRPVDGISNGFNLQVVYQDNIDTSGSSGENFSGIREIYYCLSNTQNHTPANNEYTKINATTDGRGTYITNININTPGNWYVWLKAVDYAGHVSVTSTNVPFVIVQIDPNITIEPDTVVDIGAYSTLKVMIKGLTQEQIENPNTYVQIKFPAWWAEDPYKNDGTKYIVNKTIDTTKMIKDSTFVSNNSNEYLYYFNFVPPMGVLEGQPSIKIPIEVQIITPGFGYDKQDVKNSAKANIVLTVKNTKNLSTYITENA